MHLIVIINLFLIGIHFHLISAQQEDDLQINMNKNTLINATRISSNDYQTTTTNHDQQRKLHRITNNSIKNNNTNISTKYGILSKLAPFFIEAINNNKTNKRMHFTNDLNGKHKRRHHRRYKNNKRHWTQNQTILNNTLGDLSCIINGFKPAPLVKNSVLKYLRIKNIGHTKSFLEARHHCYAGFKKVYLLKKKMKHLICRKNKWIGQIPTCELIDKSKCPNPAKCDQVCTVQEGEQKCSCFAGFKSIGNRCLDINECQTNSHLCEYGCSNTVGSYRCKCPKGYRINHLKSCTDINECLLRNGHGPCQDKCVNLIGGYNCSCAGLIGTKLALDDHSCEDVDECSNNNGGCSHICLNTLGRAFCSCPDGLRLDKDWKTCIDVNECLEQEICSYECVNTIGSFHCITDIGGDQPIVPKIPECGIGYFYDKYSKKCEEDNQLIPVINTTFEIVCPPIYPPKRGYLDCSRPSDDNQLSSNSRLRRNRITNRPGSKCILKCPKKMVLEGSYAITCNSNGNWVGDSNGICQKNPGPKLVCPKDTTIEIPKNVLNLKIPKPTIDDKFDGELSVEPTWVTHNITTITSGVTKITYTARSYVTHLTNSCSFRLTILDGEPPTIERCPETQKYLLNKKHGSLKITWLEPIFRDNVNVTNVSRTYVPSNYFSVGSHLVIYEAVDDAGYKSKCVFKILVNSVKIYRTLLQLPPI